jgi:MoaA/NifB/PqqE/SkfB family radical SAM enzyme
LPALSAPGGLSSAARKARLLGAYVKGAPVHCTWQLSPRCESFCHLCDHRAESAADELDAAGCARVAEALGRDGSLLVSFTGSEPFLRADLPEIVAAVSRRHFPLLVTNGWLVTAESARAVWAAGLEAASVALDDAEPRAHDAATGLPGAHARAVQALATLAEARTRRSQRVNVRARLRERSLDGLAGLLPLADRLGATVTVEAAFPLPRLEGAADEVVARLRELKRTHPNLRTSAPLLERLGTALRAGAPGCLAARAFFNVDHRGRVSKCLEFRSPADQVGALTERSLAEVRPQLRELAAANDCRACFYASRAEVETLYTLRGLLEGLRTLVRA